MTNGSLEALVETLGLKIVVALLADICHRNAVAADNSQGLIKGAATDWRADSATLRAVIARLKNP